MARKVKKGSYWKTLGKEPTQLLVALEDGYSNTVVEFAKIVDGKRGSFCGRIVDMDGLYRCKKDGSWFKGCQSKAQIQARAMWQLKGAFQMFLKALEEAEKLLPPTSPSASFARSYFTACIKGMDNLRKAELAE